MFRVNMFERVIGMEAVNEYAANVLADLDLNNKDVKDAIEKAVERLTELGYLDGEDDNILIASSAKNDVKAERLAGKLKGAVEDEIAENGIKAEISAGALNYDMIQQAKDLGITPGKFNIIVNLLNGDVNELKDESVKDLMARFTAAKPAQGKGDIEDEDQDDPAENASLREQKAAGKAGQAGKKEGNAPVGIPATENKAPNADSMENNVTDELAEDEEPGNVNKPQIPNKPETPVGRP